MSNSRIGYEQFRRRARLRKSVGFVYVAVALAYLGYRATIVNESALTLSFVYLAAEVIGFGIGLAMIYSSWDYNHREQRPAPQGLRVDVLVPVYREPIEVIRWTLIGATGIEYPHRTFVLDDGNRDDVRKLAAELGIRYLVRERNVDAKAGNLNHGLAHSDAEFVMVFDADHIPMPHALDVMLGLFDDPRVAMVQTPQDYYNTDAFAYYNSRRSGRLWHDQSFFYNIVLPCHDSVNASSCVGTGVVYRRSALDAIGGIPVDTVTEDFHTSLKLHKAGFEVAFLNEPVAYGIAAADLREFYKTRHRWNHGNLHAMRVENVVSCRGLTLPQRLSYFAFAAVSLEGIQQVLLYSVPIMSLTLGWAPFDITVINVLVVLLFPLVALCLLQELGCGLSRAWVNELFSVARFPVQVASWAAVFVDRMPFRTSSKQLRGRIEWHLMTPQLAVLALSVAAFATGVTFLALDFQIGPLAYAFLDLGTGNFADIEWNQKLEQGYTLDLVIVSGFWALFNAAKSLALIRKAIRDARNSHEDYRFDARLPLEIGGEGWPARVDAISRSWVSGRLYAPAVAEVGERLSGRLHLPGGPVPVEIRVTKRAMPMIGGLKLGGLAVDVTSGTPPGHSLFEGELIWPDGAACDALMRSLYSVDWHRELKDRNALFTTPLEALGRLLTLRWPFRGTGPVWSPALVKAGGDGVDAFAVVAPDRRGSQASVLAFGALAPGASVTATILATDAIHVRRMRIEAPDAPRSLAPKGLDGTTMRRFRAVFC